MSTSVNAHSRHLAGFAESVANTPLADIRSLRNAIEKELDSSRNGRWLKYNDMLDVVNAELSSRRDAQKA